jgi:intracellular septation protein A
MMLLMKLLFDIFPVFLFFIFYKIYGIYIATSVAMVASVVQVLWYRIKHQRFEWMHCVSLINFFRIFFYWEKAYYSEGDGQRVTFTIEGLVSLK